MLQRVAARSARQHVRCRHPRDAVHAQVAHAVLQMHPRQLDTQVIRRIFAGQTKFRCAEVVVLQRPAEAGVFQDCNWVQCVIQKNRRIVHRHTPCALTVTDAPTVPCSALSYRGVIAIVVAPTLRSSSQCRQCEKTDSRVPSARLTETSSG